MSLLRLLRSGKSLVDFRDSGSRYRMREKNLLPKFGSPKNPFIARPEAANPAPASATLAARRAGLALTPAEVAAARLKETMRLPVIASGSEGKRVAPSGLAARAVQGIRRFAGRVGSIFRRSRSGALERVPLPAANPSPAQGELSLDNIKVVRNDLSDTDLEVVPARSAVRKKPAAVVPAKAEAGWAATQAR